MNLEKALRILGLSPNFTEEELKKAHRRLVNQYHPDRNKSPEAEEKTKEINTAREYLVKHLKNKSASQDSYTYKHKTKQGTEYQSTFDVEAYIYKKLDQLKNIINFDHREYHTSYTIQGIIIKIQTEFQWFYIQINGAKNKQDIDREFNKFLQKIKKYFQEIKEAFYIENYIREHDVQESINYDCSLKEFYGQLLKIKNKYSIKSIINDKYRELKRIVDFNLYEYKLSANIKNIIGKIQNVPENFNSTSQSSTNKNFIENFFYVNINTIKDYFKELEEEFYKDIGINRSVIQEKINYDCTLKEFYEQLLKIKNKYSEETIISNLLEDEIKKYTSYAGYDRIKVFVRYCKTKTLNKIKENRLAYTKKDIDEMHQSILECFNRYYYIQQKMLELEQKISKIDNQGIKENFIKIKNKFKNSIKFDELENLIKKLEEAINEIEENQKKISQNQKERTINEIYCNLITRYSEILKNYNIISQQSELDNLNKFINEVLNLLKKSIEEEKNAEFFNMFNEITFKNIALDNIIIERIKKTLNYRKSNIYIKLASSNPSDNGNFFYLNEENMLMYEISFYDQKFNIKSTPITKKDLEKNYISIEEFLDKATFVGENKVDYSGRKYGLVYEMYGYSLYLDNHQFRVGYNKTFFQTADKGYTYLDEFENKEHLINLIKKEVKKKFEEKMPKTKIKPSSLQDYHTQSVDTSGKDEYYKRIFGQTPRNTDDTYGTNNSRK